MSFRGSDKTEVADWAVDVSEGDLYERHFGIFLLSFFTNVFYRFDICLGKKSQVPPPYASGQISLCHLVSVVDMESCRWGENPHG